jgi:REP element-mobilizing transposase RayT
MSFVKVMIHAVWGTKNREPFLADEARPLIIKHIRENAKSKEIYIDSLNGYTDHLHCLFGLNADVSISKAMQQIKGESAFWINKENVTKSKFEWADEYFAVSVSESMIPKVRAYIQTQEGHHKKTTFMQEYEEFMRKYNFRSHG